MYLMWTLCVLGVFGFASSAQSASFDCTRAKTVTERAICSNPDLSALDGLMGQLYQQSLRANDWDQSDYIYRDPDVKAAQTKSLRDQRNCADNETCLRRYYNGQIIYLLRLMRVIDGIDPSTDITWALLDIVPNLDAEQDLRSLAVDPISGTVAALVSDADPDQIFQAADGTVYNGNPAQILIIHGTETGLRDVATLPVGDDLTHYVLISMDQDQIILVQNYLRGSEVTYLSRDPIDDQWVLDLSRLNFVDRGRFVTQTTYHQTNISVAYHGYIYASCQIQRQPQIVGNSPYYARADWPNFDDSLLSDNPAAVAAQAVFMQGLSDLQLYEFGFVAFDGGYFDLAQRAYSILLERLRTYAPERGQDFLHYIGTVKAALACVAETKRARDIDKP